MACYCEGSLVQINEVRFRQSLDALHSGGLEPEIRLEILCNLAEQALERHQLDVVPLQTQHLRLWMRDHAAPDRLDRIGCR